MDKNFIKLMLSSTAYANAPAMQAQAAAIQTAVIASVQSSSKEDLLRRAPDMAAMLPYWDKTDTIIEGSDAVISAGETYLPRFKDEGNDDYAERLKFAKFTNIYRDIVESLAAKPFEQEIEFGESDASSDVPEEMLKFAEDVDGDGNNLTSFASSYFFNGINSSISWLFVDYPTNTGNVVTIADAKREGIKPYWTQVLARNVLEARTKVVNGKRRLSYIRIHEPAGSGEPERVRIFERNEQGVVTFTVYVRSSNTDDFIIETDGKLSIDEIPLVPFITGRRDGVSFKTYPAMRDAADLQIKLYQAESGLEWATILTSYPMLAANGMKPDRDSAGNPKKLAVGPSRVLWGVPDGNGNSGNWAYVEPGAQSLKFQQEKIDATKKDLRELGKQPLTAQSGNLTVITTAVAAGKAKSAVSAWALMLKDALENALRITTKFMGKKEYDPELNVYTDFDDFVDSASDLTALKDAREGGDLSQETYWSELKRRKVLSQDFNAETERERLLNEIPADTNNVDLSDDDKETQEPEPQPGNAA